MAESQQSSPTASRDLDETRDDLAQASLALDAAYDRLRDLRTSLRNFTAQRDRLSAGRTRQVTRIPTVTTMAPEHSAIVFSDSDEESENELDWLHEALPLRLVEQLTSRLGNQRPRLNTTRQSTSQESRHDHPSLSSTSLSEDPRPIYPPIRRRRALPAAGPSRDGGITPPGSASPARRTILEARIQQLRHALYTAESTTTLGRQVAQRAAAGHQDQGSGTEPQTPTLGTLAPSDAIVRSRISPGIEPLPIPSSLESRAANHLRYSFLPNPPSGIRQSSTSRVVGGAHPRFIDRAEHRPRTPRSNSFTAVTRSIDSASNRLHHAGAPDATSQPLLLSTRLGQLRPTVAPVSEDEGVMRFNGQFNPGDSTGGTYRIRRRLNGQGEEHVININWSDLMSEADREDSLPDPIASMAWMRAQTSSRPPRTRPGTRPPPMQDPETDDTVVQDYAPYFTREGGEGSVQRRRGWARLDADGDEVSTEDEAPTERSRLASLLPSPRRAYTSLGSSTVAVLDFVHRNSTTGHRGPHSLHPGVRQSNNTHRHIISNMFRSVDAALTYTSPLPRPHPIKAMERHDHTREVQVILTGRLAGR